MNNQSGLAIGRIIQRESGNSQKVIGEQRN